MRGTMKQSGTGNRGSCIKKAMAALLCGCMLAGSAEVSAFAADARSAARMPGAGDDMMLTGAYTEQDIELEEQQPFGAYALSETHFFRRPGKSVTMKVYGWSTEGTLEYLWYSPAGCELTEESDTLRVDDLASGEESDFGEYRCVVTDGRHTETLRFQVDMETMLAVDYDSVTEKQCYVGEPVGLSVAARDYSVPAKEITYQWYRGKERLEGQTAAQLDILHTGSVGATVAYSCMVSSGDTSVTKEFQVTTKENRFTAVIESNEKQGADGDLYYYLCGSTHTWTARIADGNPYAQYTYKWYKITEWNKTPIEEAAGNTCPIKVDDDESWCVKYACEVSDGTNKVTAAGYVEPLEEEASAYLNRGYAKLGGEAKIPAEITFASDIDPASIRYQWFKESTDGGEDRLLSGQNTATLSLSNVRQEDYGDYYCLSTWGDGQQYKAFKELCPYRYTLWQSARAGCSGLDVTYRVGSGIIEEADVLDPDSGVAYQWYDKDTNNNITPIAGATGRELVVTATKQNCYHTYFCEVTKDGQTYCSDESDDITLKDADYAGFVIRGDDPVIYYNRKYWEPITLTPYLTTFANTPELEIKWYKKIPGPDNGGFTTEWQELDHTDATYELTPEELEQSEEVYRVVVKSRTGGISTYTTNFYLRQEETLASKTTTKLDADGMLRAEPGAEVTLAVEASSKLPAGGGSYAKPTYLWKKAVTNENGETEYVKIGGTQPSHVISGLTEEDCGTYLCEVTDANETHTYLFPVALYDFVNERPERTVSVYPGEEEVFLKADVSYGYRTASLIYQWAKQAYDENGETVWIPVVGENQRTLVLPKITVDNIGNYRCTVSAGDKSTQVDFHVTFEGRFAINGRAEDIYMTSAAAGDTVRMVVEADVPVIKQVSYQWMRGAAEAGGAPTPIAGATALVYRVKLEDASDFGTYICRITVNEVSYDLVAQIMDSDAGVLTVKAAGSATERRNISCAMGETAELGVVAYCASHPLQYQWERCVSSAGEYERIEGADEAVCRFPIETQDVYGAYRCAVRCEKDDRTLYAYYNLIESDGRDDPTDTQTPGNTEKPGSTERPGATETPGSTERPTDTQAPGNTERPGATETPGDTERPGATEIPGSTERPTDTQTPGSTERPGATETPGNTERPGATETPGNTEGPGTTEKPGDTQQPSDTEDTQSPSDSQNPGDVMGPSNPGDVSDSQNPGGSAGPSNSGNTDGTQAPSNTEQPSASDSQTPPDTSLIPATAIYLIPDKSLIKGTSCQLFVTLAPAKANERVSFLSSDRKIASVDEAGRVTAVAVGTAKITAQTQSGKKAVCTVKVVEKAGKTKRIQLNKRKADMYVGDMMQLKASLAPVGSTDDLKWSSTNRKIASVDSNGVVTAKKAGKTKIKVKTKSGKSAVCTVTVKQIAKSVRLNKSAVTVKVGKRIQLKAVMKPAKSSDRLKWSSSDKKIAKVDKKGRVTGIKKGRATITVKTSGGKSAKCKVTVK